VAEKNKEYSTIIIGGGFYGLRMALFLVEELQQQDILILEKEPAAMSRASYVNQARVHNGYHYPRSLLTGHRSRVNFPDFVAEYKDAVKNDFTKYYAIAKNLSKVNARQFERFAKKIDADIAVAPKNIVELFEKTLTEQVFTVQEYAFNSHKLRDMLLERIQKSGKITVQYAEEVQRVWQEAPHVLGVATDKGEYKASSVISATYSQINALHRRSGLPLVALKHEITEMCLIELPPALHDFSVTVMDGPFFSIMPFPTTPYHTLSHVRYTPHMSWVDHEDVQIDKHDPHQYFASLDLQSNFRQMKADVQRYVPALKDIKHAKSIWEVKTVLVKSEDDDSRPILFRSDFGLDGYTCIMGGKLDNIYDVFEGLVELYGKK
jgi:glycine/D-amino acid oxidase-like deaminating enzyme